MKKLLALVLCAFMAMAMMSSALAADENVFEYDFEEEVEGDWIAIDKSINAVKKNGVIDIVKVGDTMAMRVLHTDGGGTKHDPYVNFVEGETNTYGCEQAVVVEYDVYFESTCEGMSWQILCSRETPAAGTQFQQVGYIKGADLAVTATGVEGTVMNLELKKWYSIAVAFDSANDCFSLYIDGVCITKDIDYTVADASDDYPNLFRTAFSSWDAGEACAYIDNIKVYNATEPRDIKVAAPMTTAAPETTAAQTTAAAETTAAATAAQTSAAPSTGAAAATADVAVILAAVSAIAASGAIVLKKKH